MSKPPSLPAKMPARRQRRLLLATMAAPALLQLALHALVPVLERAQGQACATMMAYAASGAAAMLGCMLAARLEAARRARSAGVAARRSLQD